MVYVPGIEGDGVGIVCPLDGGGLLLTSSGEWVECDTCEWTNEPGVLAEVFVDEWLEGGGH